MQYVVCYDVSDDRRREQLSRALLDFGKRVQESVFVATLDDELAGRMRERVKRVIEEESDRVHIFKMCEGCVGRTEVLGTGEVPVEREFYVI